MKTLYISDLDGTLLDDNAELSTNTKVELNKLIQDGMYFSIATARTVATVVPMLHEVKIQMPIVLMNGVCIYDMKHKTYIYAHRLAQHSVTLLFATLKKHSVTGFLYELKDDKLYTYYERLDSDHAKQFVSEREEKYGKKFTQVDSFQECKDIEPIYFSVCDKKEKLISIYEALQKDEKLHVEFYSDIYNNTFWYLEVCSFEASKYNAVQYLRETYTFDKVVSFGDNLNDLPMFCASDEGYAMENAKVEVKGKATAVIESNQKDGVVRWLNKNV